MTNASAKESSARELYDQARQYIARQEFDTAKTILQDSLAKEPLAEAVHDMGVIHYLEGDKETAIEFFEQAVDINPQYTQAYKNAALIFLEEGYAPMALGCYGRAIQANPDESAFKEKFLEIARLCEFKTFNPELKELYLLCMNDPYLDFSHMGASWLSMLTVDPVFKKAWKKLNKQNYQAFHKAFTRFSDHKALLEPFFILGLKKQVRVSKVEFETFMTHLRHMLLDLLEDENRYLEKNDFVTLAEAAAHYSFATEYVFYETEDETRKADQLLKDASGEEALAVLACYRALHDMPGADKIEKEFASSRVSDLIKVQITDYKRQQKFKGEIESLTETKQDVSNKVKAQYEDAPYPRWANYARMMYDENVEGYLRGKKAQILVAGCGTGHEAIELAHVFPDGHVLAIDLSFASLAYGISKAEDFDIRNITFKQADILELGGLDTRFDYIASSGVLHHMEDPEAGWDVLTNLLKPGGLMRIALYSKLSRDSLEAAKEVIREKGYGSSDEDIRQFRHDAEKLLKKKDYKKITNYVDFFSLSECRDLLFHVQEDHFTIPRIKAYLEKAGLEFIGFYNDPDVMNKYRKMFPLDLAATNLDNWEEFEKKNPDTFISMYRLWLKKK